MLLFLVICLAGLAPGLATAWYVRHRGYSRNMAALAGAAITASLPFLLLLTMAVFPPLGFCIGLMAAGLALTAYDDGKIWIATAWATVAAVALACSGWAIR